MQLKKLEIRCFKDSSESVAKILSDFGVSSYSYLEVSTEWDSESVCVISAVLPDEILNDAMGKISELLDLRKTDNQIVVTDVLAYISTKLDRLQEKYQSTKSENPLEFVIQPLEQFIRPNLNSVVLIIISIVVAIAGLFLNNEAIVVGSMILSPILGPINAVVANASLGRMRKVAYAEANVFLLVGISLLSAYLLTEVLKNITSLTITPAILIRSSVTTFDVIVAVVLGIASALGLQTKLPETLVGVAVAAALVPPLAVTGIFAALGNFHLAEQSFILAVTYLFGLKVGGMLTLQVTGFSPRKYWEASKARKYRIRSLMLFSAVVLILLLVIVFAPLSTIVP